MSRNNVIRNNKGAALVSIMIAVAFITILATALLYMSFNNYKMKVINYESKANFYETELSLTHMSTTLRNDVMTSANPLSTLETKVGVNDQDRYSALELAKLAFPSGVVIGGGGPTGGNINTAVVTDMNGDTYTISTTVPNGIPNYIVEEQPSNIKKITLQGVGIEHLEKRTKNTNKITTDLVMYIKEKDTPDNIGGIGEFSLLMDSSVSATSASGIKINVFGNGFFMGTNFNGSESLPGQAIYLTGQNTYNFLGDYNFVYGDIVLRDGAAINVIGGSLTVYGNIYLNDKSTLTCNGRLYFPDSSITDPSTGMSYGIHCAGAAQQHLYPSDLQSNVLYVTPEKCNELITDLKLNDGDESNDGLVKQILQKQKASDGSGSELYYYDHELWNGGNDFKASGVAIDGINYYTHFTSVNVTNGGDLANQLVFLNGPTEIKDRNENATLISQYPVTFGELHELNLTKMGTNVFNYLTLTQSDMTAYPGVKYIDNVHQIRLKNNKYYEVGGFFTDNANSFVQQVMGNAVNGGSGTPTYSSTIGYQNWSKE